ncbi:MAG TPA: hypothetical protein VHX67_04135, partial [Acidimicrobiales bacterium]|nr:hypothetical protein [Acidimicrobiales bacterium]
MPWLITTPGWPALVAHLAGATTTCAVAVTARAVMTGHPVVVISQGTTQASTAIAWDSAFSGE